MNEVMSKFNLYELFRILLPGSYFVYMCYEYYETQLKEVYKTEEWPLLVLAGLLLSLIVGNLIYALDLCRMFKRLIKRLPSNMMTAKYKDLYPRYKQRENEHRYYEWYEKSDRKSKKKTELQSGLYHMAISFSFVSIIGIIISIYQHFNGLYSKITYYNIFVLYTSLVSAFVIVWRRLQYQWERNYWEFEEEVIKKPKSEQNRNSI